MKAPWLKEKGDRHVCVVRTRDCRSAMDDPVRSDRLVGPTICGDDRSPGVAGPRVGGIGAARVHGIRRPGPVPHTYTPQGTAVAVLPSIDAGFMDRAAPVIRRVLGMVSAGTRFRYVKGVPAAIQRRTRAAPDVRAMVPSRSATGRPGRHRAGLGVQTAHERALRAAPDVVSL